MFVFIRLLYSESEDYKVNMKFHPVNLKIHKVNMNIHLMNTHMVNMKFHLVNLKIYMVNELYFFLSNDDHAFFRLVLKFLTFFWSSQD